MKRRSLIIAAILLGGIAFTSGFIANQYLIASRNSQSEKFTVEGYAVVKAYHADGTLYATWQGYNTLQANGISTLAQCLSGQTSGGTFLGSCSPITAYVFVDDTNYNEYRNTSTNTLTPTGCNPLANPGTCTGWQAQTTIDFSSLTSSVTIMRGGTEGPSIGAFDLISITPNITVNPGDRLIVTITFTIT